MNLQPGDYYVPSRQPGDFFLAPIPGDVGGGIRLGIFLNGEGFLPIQHAGIYLGNGKTIEAMPGGAIIGDIDRYKPEELIWSSGLVELTDDQREKICATGWAMKGTPYSFADYAAIAAHRAHLPVPGLKTYIRNSGHLICSQLVDRIYDLADVHLFTDKRWEGYVTPGSLYHLLDNIYSYNLGMGL